MGRIKWKLTKMTFFQQIRNYIVFFILFGLWSAWEDSKYTLQINLSSFLSITIVFGEFFSAYFLNKFYTFNSLSNIVANLIYIFIITSNLIMVIESFYKKGAQTKFIQNMTHIDHLFNTKLKVTVPYYKEKGEIFMWCLIMSLIVFLNHIIFAWYMYHLNLNIQFYFVALYSYSVVNLLRPIQLTFFICLLRSRLILINEELKGIQNVINAQSSNVNQRKSNGYNIRNGLILEENSINNRLMTLKLIYEELFESCELINEAFGWSLLANTTGTFTDFISHSYWGYMCRHNFGKLIITINFFASKITTLGTLAFYCSSCFQQVSFLNNSIKLNLFCKRQAIFILESSSWSQS